jgi:aerobic C4-dicarboxylate transport protein
MTIGHSVLLGYLVPSVAVEMKSLGDGFIKLIGMRALANVIGNDFATIVIARWEGELDTERMERCV